MRGSDDGSGSLFSYVNLEARVPMGHPLRVIRQIANGALAELNGDFSALYAQLGRPSIPPEKLLRASLLQAFYSIRSERQLMERLQFDLLFRWFVGLGIDDPVWDHSVFSKNRDRLLEGEIAAKFLASVLMQPKVKRLLSSDHFSVDGTLVEAWASMKSLKPRDGGGDPPTGGGRNAGVSFRGEKRSNDTHVSTSDPDAMLYRKGPGMEARLCFIGHALMENQHGLFVDARLTGVSGHAERLAALNMVAPHADRPQAITLGGDKGYDAADFVMELREINVTPHIACNTSRRSAIDGRTTRHPGYAISLRIRKRIEEGFGWMKTVAGMRKTKYRGIEKVRLGLHPRCRRLQPDPVTEAFGGAGVMALKKSSSSASAFKGRWRIKEMDLWDKDAIDLVEPGFIAFNGEEGEMRFIAVRAWLDIRYGTRDGVPIAEFSWEGIDEGDQRSGRGWAMLEANGGLVGHIFFHNGDDSAFTCHLR